MIWRRGAAKVRRLTAKDAALWRDLRLEALLLHPEAYGSTHDDWAGQPLAAFADRLAGGMIFGAFDGVDLIGSMALDSAPGEPETGEITAVYVQTASRGKGIARALMKTVLTEAKRAKMQTLTLSVALNNQDAVQFYQAAGFRCAGQEPRALASDGQFLDLIRMVRPIRA